MFRDSVNRTKQKRVLRNRLPGQLLSLVNHKLRQCLLEQILKRINPHLAGCLKGQQAYFTMQASPRALVHESVSLRPRFTCRPSLRFKIPNRPFR